MGGGGTHRNDVVRELAGAALLEEHERGFEHALVHLALLDEPGNLAPRAGAGPAVRRGAVAGAEPTRRIAQATRRRTFACTASQVPAATMSLTISR